MNRLTDNDKTWGPFTLARWRKSFSFYFQTGDEEERTNYRNNLLLIAFGWALRIALPNLIPPWRIRHEAVWDAATVKRLGRNHYFETHERRFGFSVSDMGNGYDFLQVFYGAQTYASNTTKSWCKHFPWKQWRCIRWSLYEPNGMPFARIPIGQFSKFFQLKEACPSCQFTFKDYDGEPITATCTVEEREWHRGEGWFKWLRFFYRSKVRRSLDLKFSAEVGPEKGSWKGGTTGHGIDMLKGETPAQAFDRYCRQEHRSKSRRFKIENTSPL